MFAQSITRIDVQIRFVHQAVTKNHMSEVKSNYCPLLFNYKQSYRYFKALLNSLPDIVYRRLARVE